MIEALQQNFLHPIGLSALLALIPLIVFYLVKPKPKEEVMPSMAFFSEEKKEGKIRNALEKLKRNKLLLLHIFFVCLAALAIANPVVPGLESDGESVIVLDASASMHDNRQAVESFAKNHLGEQNTIITVSQSPEIAVESASTERARGLINEYSIKAEGTDLISALRLASNYPGKVVIASDMAHTATGQDLDPVINELAADRTVKVMDVSQRNSHGFTDLEVENSRAQVTAKNFVNRNRTVEISKPGENREVTLESRSTRTLSLELEPGLHEISLPPDEFAMDNRLYISIPEQQKIRISRLGEKSRYFREAIELINSTEYSQGLDKEADVYFVSEEFDLDSNSDRLEQEIQNGASVIYERREDIAEYAPVENFSGTDTTQIQISTGMATSFQSSVNRYDATGQPLAEPEEALVLSENESMLLYNVEDEKFGEKITYPIFWKNILHRMTDLKTGGELNIRTGRSQTFAEPVRHSGETMSEYTEIDHVGFYRGQHSYAANMLNPSESAPHTNTITSETNIGENPGSDPAQKYLTALLALIAGLELTYLSWRGEV
jgi:hypothetical protein